MERRNVDELFIADITASEDRRLPQFDFLSEVLSNIFAPITVCGGVGDLETITRLLGACGADKVGIKSNYQLIYDAARKFGSQAVVAIVDYDIGPLFDQYTVDTICRIVQDAGAGEVLLTAANLDGTMAGYDLSLADIVVPVVNIPVILNGGCGHPYHMVEAFEHGVDAVAAGSLFLYTEFTPRACAQICREHGVEVREDTVR